MRFRYNVSKNSEVFASVVAETPEQAICRACKITGRQPEGCKAVPVLRGMPEKIVDRED